MRGDTSGKSSQKLGEEAGARAGAIADEAVRYLPTLPPILPSSLIVGFDSLGFVCERHAY